ncbi:MAG: hypothetical protein KC591_05825, partial [Gemmatimonadetes bacterium]|nr:hypothetical protein [Gemmatimonadota bacterium]
MRLRRPRFGPRGSGSWFVLLALVAFAPARAATPLTESGFASRVDELRETGQITWEEGLLLQFQRVFAPGELPAGLRSDDAIPTKSATGLVWEFERMRGGLSIPVRALIEGYLAPRSAEHEYVTAHFRFAYDTSGEGAVPAEDLD